MKKILYDCRKLNFFYRFGDSRIQALKDVDLKVYESDFMCVFGPSGSGKSTLLSLLGIIENVQDGDIRFKGKSITNASEREKNHLRRYDLGFIFQDFNFIPVLTAYENVEYFLIKQGIPRAGRDKLVMDALAMVGLEDHMNKRPMQMSGGQRQRIAIARAVVKRPGVIIADEPTASLDQHTGRGVMEIFQRLCREQGVSVIIASHDPMVIDMAQRRIRLVDGETAEEETGGTKWSGEKNVNQDGV